MHPLFVTLFIETDADDLLAGEQDRKRRARAVRRGRSARARTVAPLTRVLSVVLFPGAALAVLAGHRREVPR